MSRARTSRVRVGLACGALAAALLPALVLAPPAQAVVPKAPALPVQIDAFATYQGQTVCSPAPKPGTLRLSRLLKATYGSYSIGISRACSVGGQSEHKEGRALDWMVGMRVASQRAKAEAFLAWLLRPGADGQPAEMARRLGVMYLGWNNHFWAAYDAGAGWTDLKGCSTDPAKKASGYDTYCHRNHVHISLSWEGAYALTSFWSGTAIAPPCDSGWSQGDAVPAGTGSDLVPVAPVRVLDTRLGAGLDSPCRLTAPQGWDGTRRDVVVHVTDVGGVPAAGVAAVAVRVTTSRTVLPGATTVSVRTTAASALRPVVTALSTASSTATNVVPVATDGTIRFTVDQGSADLQVDVVGYVPLAVPGATPDPGTGRTHLVPTTLVYDGTGHPLAPGTSRTLHLAGVGPVPVTGLTGLALTMTTDRATAPTYVGVLTGTLGKYVGSIRSSTAASRAVQVLAPTTDGTVVLRNTGSSAAVVHLYLDAWFSTEPATGGATMATRSTPYKVVDSSAGLRLSGAVTSTAPRVVTLTGVAGVPAGAHGLLLAVSALGGATAGTLSVGSVAAVQAVSFGPRQWSHEVVLLPLAPSGAVSVRSSALGAQVRIWVLGYVA